MRVSVVIPTLGEKHLIKTVNQLNKGTIIPKEVLICIPKKNGVTEKLKSYKNIVVLETSKHGQVFQRSVGFLKTRYQYVLQLDDDVIIDEDCIENLLKTFEYKNDMMSVSPLILDYATKSSVYPLPKKNFINSILYFVLNGSVGYSGGGITKAGTGIGINSDLFPSLKIKTVEWLPGGCVLHKKKYLITKNYFPFEGKAYNEDLIHSFLLRKKGNKLLVNLTAKIYIHNENPMENISFRKYLLNLKKDFIARNFYLTLEGNILKIRMYIYYILIMLKFVLLKIYKNR